MDFKLGATRRRKRLIAASISLAALLGAAPAAPADTTVSVEDGQFGSGLVGKHVFIRDTPSWPFDMKMAVVATRSGGDIVVTDAVGEVHAQGVCDEVGNTVRCPDGSVAGLRFEGGNKNDSLTNSTDLIAAMLGNYGDDVLNGGTNRDQMNGQDGKDKAFGGDGNDTVFAEPGGDVLHGQGGSGDAVEYAAATGPLSVQLDDTSANDGVAGEGDQLLGIEIARGSNFADVIDGSDEPNTLAGRAGADTIRGGAGDDRLLGGTGPDSIDGEAGTDAADYTDRTLGVAVHIDGQPNDGNADDGAPGQRDDVDTENILGSSGPDTMTGDAGPNHLDGRDGDDRLTGGAGTDRYSGGPGSDDLFTQDGETDVPISCGEDSGQDASLDAILADEADLLANPAIAVPGDPAECELRSP